MTENLKQILGIIEEKPEIQEKLKHVDSLEETYEMVRAVRSGHSLEEFKEATKEFNYKAFMGFMTIIDDNIK